MVDLQGHKLHYGGSFPTQWFNSNSDLKPDLIILPPKNAPIIIGELTSPMLPKMKWWNEEKERKYKDHLVPKMNRPASVRAFEVGHLKHLPHKSWTKEEILQRSESKAFS